MAGQNCNYNDSRKLISDNEMILLQVTPKVNSKYQSNNCSVVVEAQPGYQNSSSRISNQQALVHREDLEDHSSG